MKLFVVYKNATDSIYTYCVREWNAGKTLKPKELVFECDSLEELREHKNLMFPYTTTFSRHPTEDPVIYEVWI